MLIGALATSEEREMTDKVDGADQPDRADIEQGRYDRVPERPIDEVPTAYGGSTAIEPEGPGQSLGRVPDPEDADVDEAGDHLDAGGSSSGARREGVSPRIDIQATGTTAEPDPPNP
jgi:hypothetical protein